MQTADMQQASANRQNEMFRRIVAVFMVAMIGFGVLELMGVVHV